MDNSKRDNFPMQERLDLNKTQSASTPKEVKCMQNVPYASAVGSIVYAIRCTRLDVTNPKAELRVDCYYNARFETDRDETKSQIGYVFILNGRRSRMEKLKNKVLLHTSYRQRTGVQRGARHYHRRYLLKVHTDDNLADPFTKALSKGKLTQHARSMGLCKMHIISEDTCGIKLRLNQTEHDYECGRRKDNNIEGEVLRTRLRYSGDNDDGNRECVRNSTVFEKMIGVFWGHLWDSPGIIVSV
ncbi:hypothetical protein Tco_0589324 [Tanacetum coccineum]